VSELPHNWPLLGTFISEFNLSGNDPAGMARFIEALAEVIIRGLQEEGEFDPLRRN
jgi:hypothetical protein